jgi:hypothetical protein
MQRASPTKIRSLLARVSIWTIVNHDFLAGHIRIYVWTASATLLFFSIASIIPIHIALYLLLFCGCTLMILLWTLINWRKSILLSIRDQAMRQSAHAAMLALIRARQADCSDMQRRGRPLHRWLHRKSSS